MKYNDNGFKEWSEVKKIQKKKQLKLFISLTTINILLSLFIYFFGYGKEVENDMRLTNVFAAFFGLSVLCLIISKIKYRINKYKIRCNKCGEIVGSFEENCIIGDINYIGTVDKTEYENIESTTTINTEYGKIYADKIKRPHLNDRFSTSKHTTQSKIPIVKRYHVYEIEYKCKNCGDVIGTMKKETLEPFKIKD